MAGKPKKFHWTDEKVIAFARAYTQGTHGIMKRAKTIEQKLKQFKLNKK